VYIKQKYRKNEITGEAVKAWWIKMKRKIGKLVEQKEKQL
jgi:hypothetical protein